MKRCCALFLSLCLLCLTGCTEKKGDAAPSPDPSDYQRYSYDFFDTFDTVISLTAYATSQDAFDRYAEQAHEAFRYLHRLFDAYQSDPDVVNVYRLNEAAPEAPVPVEPELFALLFFAREQHAQTGGTVNIAMGSVLRLWHDAREEGLANPEEAALPDLAALQAAAEHMDIDDLILDEANQTVYFRDPGLRLDVGAVAKGWATEKVGEMLRESGLTSFILNAGGNVRAGSAPLQTGRTTWSIGIQGPAAALGTSGVDTLAATFYGNDLAVVTSGTYQRYFTVEGTRYHHLIDPRTLMPATYYDSVSILAPDAGLADVLSTAAFLLPFEESLALIEGLEGVEAFWIFTDGQTHMTDGAREMTQRP